MCQRVSGSGALFSTDLYDGWGKKRSGPPDVWGYGGQAGYYTDTETGLLLCTHRFYDPQGGRFLTRDPIGYAGGHQPLRLHTEQSRQLDGPGRV